MVRVIAGSTLALAMMTVAACSPPSPPPNRGAGDAQQNTRAAGPDSGSNAPGPPAGAVVAAVERVVDGDTIVVRVDDRHETVRLLGIDTPEKPGGPRPAECFGAQASAYSEQLLPRGSTVVLSRDEETRDAYGRLLAFVHRDDGLFVNLALVETGHATTLFFAPNTSMEPTFNDAANRARRSWIGFWPACGAANVTLASGDPP